MDSSRSGICNLGHAQGSFSGRGAEGQRGAWCQFPDAKQHSIQRGAFSCAWPAGNNAQVTAESGNDGFLLLWRQLNIGLDLILGQCRLNIGFFEGKALWRLLQILHFFDDFRLSPVVLPKIEADIARCRYLVNNDQVAAGQPFNGVGD